MVIDLLQVSDLPLWSRMIMLYQFSQTVNMNNAEQRDALIEQYNSVDNILSLYKQITEVKYNNSDKLQVCLNLVQKVVSLSDDSYAYAKYIVPIFQWITSVPVGDIVEAWEEYQSIRNECEQFYENVMVNSLFKLGNGAYDDTVFSSVILLVIMNYSVNVFTSFLWWLYNEKKITQQEENEIISFYARKIDHLRPAYYQEILRYLAGDKDIEFSQVFLWSC